MARKSRYNFDQKKIDRFIAEGRGQGSGSDYKPWFNVSDIASKGRSHRVRCPQTEREHHLLSDNEYRAFLDRAWDPRCVDIREQFPLCREETLEIAQELGIRHPKDQRTKVNLVMTTDLLVTYQCDGFRELRAYSVDEDKIAEQIRRQAKQAIEKTYWERRHVNWSQILRSQLKNKKSLNLSWIFGAIFMTVPIPEKTRENILCLFISLIERKSIMTLAEAARHIDTHFKIQPGTSLIVARKALASRSLAADLAITTIVDLPLKHFKMEGVR